MPNYKGHLVGGLVVYGMIFFGLLGALKPSMLTAGEWLLFTLAGALFPDIDIKSKGQKYFYYVIFLFFIVLVAKEQFHTLTCCSFIIMSPMLVRHRGIFHNPLFVTAMPLLVWFCASIMVPHVSRQLFFDAMFFIAGALSHIWLDFGTSQMFRRLLSRKKSR
ncbi:MAG TPA: metal-dependent hydrolase [Candidatus Babeliales bacterium]|nr:metal-dependent hydrolase [Candidatus Babeliales bacterium]